MNNLNIGNRIKKLRTEKDLMQKELSNILSLSPSSISNYEKDAYWPDLKTICKMADYFNVTTDYILGRTEYRCPPEVLDKYVTKDYMIHNIVNTLLTMDSNSLNTVLTYVNFLKNEHDSRLEKQQDAAYSENARNSSAPVRQSHKTYENAKNGEA